MICSYTYYIIALKVFHLGEHVLCQNNKIVATYQLNLNFLEQEKIKDSENNNVSKR